MSFKIEFAPSKKQWLAWERLTDNQTLYIGYGGSAFSGKSFLMCHWILIQALAYPGTAWGLGRNEITTLKKTTLQTFFKICASSALKPSIDYTYNQQLNTITLKNGSIVYLIDMAYKPSDPEYTRFGGLELTCAGVDESAEADRKAIEILFTRTGRAKNHEYGITRKLLETFNPDKGHVYERYYLPYKDKSEAHDRCFIPALPSDNPSPEVESYISGILSTASDITIQRLIYGNFEYDDTNDKLFETTDLWRLFTPRDPIPKGVKYITADIALEGADQFVIGVWDGWHLYEVQKIDKSKGREVLDTIQSTAVKHNVRSDHICFDADGLGGFLDGWLGDAHPFKNNATALKGENYQNLKTQCVYHFARLTQEGVPYISVQEIKDEFVREAEAHRKKDMDKEQKMRIKPKEEVKALIGRSPDIFDMILMRVIFDLKPTAKAEHIWWL